MGATMPAAYHRDYRARRRLSGNPVRRRAGYTRPARGDRSAEYSQRQRPSRAIPAVPLLMPQLQRGVRLAFWNDELRLDLAQEYQLARLEGRDPVTAVAVYHARETNWLAHIAPLFAAA